MARLRVDTVSAAFNALVTARMTHPNVVELRAKFVGDELHFALILLKKDGRSVADDYEDLSSDDIASNTETEDSETQ